MEKRILIVDDDCELVELLEEFLRGHAFFVESVHDGEAAISAVRRGSYDAVVLDVMLPKKNGFEVCAAIREESRIPIIMLTACGTVDDKVKGLETGADDYLPKPFEPRELVARLGALVRRSSPVTVERMYRFQDLEIRLDTRSVEVSGNAIALTTAEFEVLALFAKKPGEVLNRDQISDYLRGVECPVFSRSIDIVVSRLRQKLGDDPKTPRFLKTIWGSGYMFVAASPTGTAEGMGK